MALQLSCSPARTCHQPEVCHGLLLATPCLLLATATTNAPDGLLLCNAGAVGLRLAITCRPLRLTFFHLAGGWRLALEANHRNAAPGPVTYAVISPYPWQGGSPSQHGTQAHASRQSCDGTVWENGGCGIAEFDGLTSDHHLSENAIKPATHHSGDTLPSNSPPFVAEPVPPGAVASANLRVA